MLILFNVGIQFSYYHLLKRLSFPHWIALAPSSMRRFISGLSIVYMSVFMLIQLRAFLRFCLFVCLQEWVVLAARGLSLVVVSGGYSLLQCRLLIVVASLLLQSTGSRHGGSAVVALSP